MNKTISMLAALLTAAAPGIAQAQSSESAVATGSTTIVQPIAITRTADLSFGRLLKPASGTAGAMVLSDADELELEVGIEGLDDVSRAKFTITGEGGQAVSVSVPTGFTMSKGPDTIAVELVPEISGSVTLSGTLGSSGSAALNIGGFLYIDSSQPTGLYSGTFTVTVAYQ